MVSGSGFLGQFPMQGGDLMTNAEIVRRGLALGVDYALTVSCYEADAEGRACGACDACRFRREGFRAAGVSDPTRYRA